jgi:hypothetical protein
MGHDLARQSDLANRKPGDDRGEDRVGSSSASRRSWGKPLLPREAGGRPKCRSSTGRSGTSIVVPSKLTSRRPRYHAPGAPGSASGRAIRRKSSRNGASPRRTRAWVMADLHANPRAAPSQCSQRSPSTNSRSTASYEA